MSRFRQKVNFSFRHEAKLSQLHATPPHTHIPFNGYFFYLPVLSSIPFVSNTWFPLFFFFFFMFVWVVELNVTHTDMCVFGSCSKAVSRWNYLTYGCILIYESTSARRSWHRSNNRLKNNEYWTLVPWLATGLI